jgi:hypothetical protein
MEKKLEEIHPTVQRSDSFTKHKQKMRTQNSNVACKIRKIHKNKQTRNPFSQKKKIDKK